MSAPSLPPVCVIAGPTASGKSAAAVALAERACGVIINADASQLYADLRVLSARPSMSEEARVPHRLYGVKDGAEPADAAWWAAAATREIDAVHARGALPVVVGGSGLYLRALLQGMAPTPPVDPAIREAVRALGAAEAWAALGREDPGAAARLKPGDRQRVARALEVVRSTGRTLQAWQARREGGIADRITLLPVVVEVPAALLGAAIARRFEAMLDAGALAEAESLRARGLSPELPVMKAVGVPQLIAHLEGRMPLSEAREAAIIATRQYAKRQRTWLRNQTPDWPRAPANEAAARIIRQLATILRT